ncbi:RBR-type E3 ubiquitin transferase, partial [Haematococcus lacustris]
MCFVCGALAVMCACAAVQCKYEFCWLCQGEWKEHGERTGGYYNCNRWDAHQKARVKARSDSAIVSREWLERLSEQTKTPTSQLKFIMDAWQQ